MVDNWCAADRARPACPARPASLARLACALCTKHWRKGRVRPLFVDNPRAVLGGGDIDRYRTRIVTRGGSSGAGMLRRVRSGARFDGGRVGWPL